MPQAKRPGTHRRNKIGIWVEDDDSQPARQAAHESFTENVAGAYRKGILHHISRQHTDRNDRIDVALVVRGEDERSLAGQIFQTRHAKVKKITGDHLDDARHGIPYGVEGRMRILESKNLRVSRFFRKDGFPAGESHTWRGIPGLCTCENGVDQIANGIDFGELCLLNIAAEFVFDPTEKLDALHGVETEVEFQIHGGPQARRTVACGFTDNG